MTRGELVQDLRVVLDDRAEPYLWDTAYLIRKLDEATDDECIRGSLMLVTATVACTAGTREYAMPTGWYQILSGAISTGRDLIVIGASVALDDDPEYLTVQGLPDRIVIEREGYFALTPVPDADATVTLWGYRVPTGAERLAGGNDNTQPTGVALDQHAALVHGAAARAYQVRDADAGSLDRSAYHEAQFTAAFGPKVSAQLLALRRRVRGYRTKPQF